MEINKYVEALVDNAIAEDVGDGDHTTLSIIPEDVKGKVQLLVKEDGILAGVEVAQYIYHRFDPDIKVEVHMDDGSEVLEGDIAFIAEGRVVSLLQAERLVLNIMQRMSGVATQTHFYVRELNGLHTKVLDTRKTTPGMRILDKAAVKIGGGENHRMGLFDMILIKDNHIDFAGGINEALEKVKRYLEDKKKNLKIEIEARNIEDVEQILSIGGVDRIMLDNFSPEETRKAVEMINGRFETESSGGITITNLRRYGECGVDYISVGALTHQIKSLDLSLKAID